MSANKLFFDIETLPADEASSDKLRYLFERYLKKQKEKGKTEEEVGTYEDFLVETGFDGAYGRVLVIAYALNNEPVKYICNPDDEKKTLDEFWDIAGKVDMFIGHNIRDFDLPFIMQRSIILGVKPSWNKFQQPGQKPWEMTKFLDFARYKNCPIFDTMWEWSNWVDSRKNKTLEHIALAMGIPTPKEGIDGSQVAAFFKHGKVKEICEYCMRDVETTRAVYKRMTFESTPEGRLPF